MAVESAIEKLRSRGALPAIDDKPPSLVSDDPASGCWVCNVCGNPNHLSRRNCFMQVCAAPRGFPGPYTTAVRPLPPPVDPKRRDDEDGLLGSASTSRTAGNKNTSHTSRSLTNVKPGSKTSSQTSRSTTNANGAAGGGSTHNSLGASVGQQQPTAAYAAYGQQPNIFTHMMGNAAAAIAPHNAVMTPQWMMPGMPNAGVQQAQGNPAIAMPMMASGPDGAMYVMMAPQPMHGFATAAPMQAHYATTGPSPGQPQQGQPGQPGMVPMMFYGMPAQGAAGMQQPSYFQPMFQPAHMALQPQQGHPQR